MTYYRLLILKKAKQKVRLNGQNCSWVVIKAAVLKGSVLGTLFFLIFINDLSDDLALNSKLFACDTSLYSVLIQPTT